MIKITKNPLVYLALGLAIGVSLSYINGLRRNDVMLRKETKSRHYADSRDSKTWPQVLRLMKKSKDGSSEAAYELLTYYTFSEPNPTAAYFWALHAQKLGHPKVDADVVRSMESAVWNVIPPEFPKAQEISDDEDILPKE